MSHQPTKQVDHWSSSPEMSLHLFPCLILFFHIIYFGVFEKMSTLSLILKGNSCWAEMSLCFVNAVSLGAGKMVQLVKWLAKKQENLSSLLEAL